jgi:hypothetical protein
MKHLFRTLFQCTLIWNRDRHQGLLPHEPFRIVPDAYRWMRYVEFLCSIQYRHAYTLYTHHYMAHQPLVVLTTPTSTRTPGRVGTQPPGCDGTPRASI